MASAPRASKGPENPWLRRRADLLRVLLRRAGSVYLPCGRAVRRGALGVARRRPYLLTLACSLVSALAPALVPRFGRPLARGPRPIRGPRSQAALLLDILKLRYQITLHRLHLLRGSGEDDAGQHVVGKGTQQEGHMPAGYDRAGYQLVAEQGRGQGLWGRVVLRAAGRARGVQRVLRRGSAVGRGWAGLGLGKLGAVGGRCPVAHCCLD
mmetsp:Transcript_44808/g.97428  ORF Transcript_44808/g.97428 Transcript_44808/m.97428 type:complete len:210 (+) Transcript_44808:65-694(+)